jgi:hypothetical protein
MRRPIRAMTAIPPTTPPTMAPIGALEEPEGAGVGGGVELDVVLAAIDKVVELEVGVGLFEVGGVELCTGVELVTGVEIIAEDTTGVYSSENVVWWTSH